MAGAGWRARVAVGAGKCRASDEVPVAGAQAVPRAAFWVGLMLLMAASASLEWTRLYQWEPRLPGHAGGVLGFTLGPLSMKWLGFAGSGVLWIAALVAGMALALGFSWLRLAEAASANGHRRSARAASAAQARARRRLPPRREAAGRAGQVVEVERNEVGGPGADRHRPDAARISQVRTRGQGTAEAAVRRTGRHPTATGGPARCGAAAASKRDARIARDDLAPDREEAQGFRRRGARRRGLPGAGDHALRDRAGHRRQGCPGGQPGERPGALARAGEHSGGRDDPRQERHGARTAQRRARRSAWPRSWARRSTTTRLRS